MAKIDKLLSQMGQQDASDLHLSVGFPPMFRQRGSINPLKMGDLSAEYLTELLYEIMAPSQVETLEKEWDLDFSYEVENVSRFRANIFYDHRGIGAVFRVIPSDILTLEQLNCPPSIQALAEAPRGLILVTGPTGSGKSTTLAGMINHINETRDAHIITIEDPIEFVHKPKRCLITQREMHFHARDFGSALKAACREDPDVILVGEMRDFETISMALQAAELGVLVFGTLHTNNAAKTVDRVIDVFPAEQQSQVRTMLGESLKGVVAQQLLPRVGGRGRAAAHEILVGGTALGNLIREGKNTLIASLIQTGTAQGMISMDQSLINLVEDGVVTKREALSRAADKTIVERAKEPSESEDQQAEA